MNPVRRAARRHRGRALVAPRARPREHL